MTSLESRVQRLEDIEEIRRLKLRYALLCDNGYDPDALADLYTEDAQWIPTVNEHYTGRASIREYWASVSDEYSFAMHYMTGHSIDILPSGTEATGTWYLIEPATVSGKATWLSASYTDRYEKVDGVWKFSYVELHIKFHTLHTSDWVTTPALPA